jgi:hypothetical protein
MYVIHGPFSPGAAALMQQLAMAAERSSPYASSTNLQEEVPTSDPALAKRQAVIAAYKEWRCSLAPAARTAEQAPLSPLAGRTANVDGLGAAAMKERPAAMSPAAETSVVEQASSGKPAEDPPAVCDDSTPDFAASAWGPSASNIAKQHAAASAVASGKVKKADTGCFQRRVVLVRLSSLGSRIRVPCGLGGTW